MPLNSAQVRYCSCSVSGGFSFLSLPPSLPLSFSPSFSLSRSLSLSLTHAHSLHASTFLQTLHGYDICFCCLIFSSFFGGGPTRTLVSRSPRFAGCDFSFHPAQCWCVLGWVAKRENFHISNFSNPIKSNLHCTQNAAIRNDVPDAMVHAAMFARAINSR